MWSLNVSEQEKIHHLLENHHSLVTANLVRNFGQSVGSDLQEPAGTITAKDTFGLVTVHGEQYEIADIGLRMLSPRELFRAQGFDDSYIIDPIYSGKPLTKTAQVRMCGNSVSPYPAAALVRDNMKIQPAVIAA